VLRIDTFMSSGANATRSTATSGMAAGCGRMSASKPVVAHH
jgi:hypothetical protein